MDPKIVDTLKNLITGCKSQGLVKRLKTNNGLYNIVLDLKTKSDHRNLNETIFCILNNIQQRPTCCKCGGFVHFTTFENGYNQYCWKCGCVTNMQKAIKEKYGVDNIAHLEGINEKKKQTCRKRYGVDSSNQLESVKEKKKETLYKNYGDLGLSNPIIKERKIQTNLERYNVEHPTQTKEVQDKKKATCKERYGVENVMYVESIQQKVSDSWYNNRDFVEYVKKLVDSREFDLVSEYTCAHDKITIKCRKCQTEFQIIWNDFQQGQGLCPTCYPQYTGFSKPEEDIINFLSSKGIVGLERRNKQLISPFEIDILHKDKKIAIEYCGLWFHSSGQNSPRDLSKNYQLDKLKMCQKLDYDLITIFEDEWILKEEIVKSKLLLFFGINSEFERIHARKCQIKEIDFITKKLFLDSYHLQNDKVSTVNLGAFFDDQLVSVMTFLKLDNDEWQLERYCCQTNYIIPGMFSKLLNFFKINFAWSKINTYADKRWSIGDVYLRNGFERINDTDPNYWYWGKGIKGRAHRLNFTRDKLKDLPNYSESLTEFQIMALNKYSWVYDCGNIRFELKNLK